MTTAILNGYYGFHNAGDDAFVAVLAWGTRKYLGCDEILAAGRQVPQTYGIPVRPLYFKSSIRGIGRLSLARTYRAAHRADAVILGGGSILHTRKHMEHYRHLVRLAKPGTCFAAGVSIGPFQDSGAEIACAHLLNELDFVGVRDVASLERGHALAPQARIVLTFDLAPLMLQALPKSLWKPVSQERRGLGISLCSLSNSASASVEEARSRLTTVAAAVRQGIAQGLFDEVVLVDVNRHPRSGDQALHTALAQAIGSGVTVRRVPYQDDPAAVMRTIGGLRGIVAMRLHAAVFAFCTQTPALIFDYHEKCGEWASMVDAPTSLRLDAIHPDRDALAQALERLLTPGLPLPGLTPDEAVEKALKNWSWIGQ